MKFLTIALILGILTIVALSFMPFWVWAAVIYVGLFLMFGFSLCMAAHAGDEIARRARREAVQERKARSQIYGSGGWRV